MSREPPLGQREMGKCCDEPPLSKGAERDGEDLRRKAVSQGAVRDKWVKLDSMVALFVIPDRQHEMETKRKLYQFHGIHGVCYAEYRPLWLM